MLLGDITLTTAFQESLVHSSNLCELGARDFSNLNPPVGQRGVTLIRPPGNGVLDSLVSNSGTIGGLAPWACDYVALL